MVTSTEVSASPDSSSQWRSINWMTIEQHVLKLQMRIAKATREGKHGKAKALQWILTHSRAAKFLAVKRVSQNKGSKTPGIDGIIWNTDARCMAAVTQLSRKGYQAKPLRRIYIPKKNGKLRPLGIPCMIDRAQQALHLLALEPISETIADPNSYGFRPNRSTADAIAQCFKCLCLKRSAQWVLEGDIKACFDKIGHQWLIDNIQTDKRMLMQWLQCGFIAQACCDLYQQSPENSRVMAPTKALVAEVNKLIQSVVNSSGSMLEFDIHGEHLFLNLRLNDTILFTQNHYEKGIQNGSLGTLTSIGSSGEGSYGEVTLDTGDKVEITQSILDCMSLGYAITLHKAQGSQFPRIIIALQKGKIVDRAWLYTAITRAESEIHIVGSADDFKVITERLSNTHNCKSYLINLLK